MAATTQTSGAPPEIAAPRQTFGLNRLGAALAVLALFALFAQPFMLSRANRIVAAEPLGLWASLSTGLATLTAIIVTGAAVILALRTPPLLRLLAASLALITVGIAIGIAASGAVSPETPYARSAPGAGVWLILFAFALAVADALVALRLGAWARIAALAVTGGVIAAFLSSGIWADLSVMKEYGTRAPAFNRELVSHILLSLGSVVAATVLGVPLAILCYRSDVLRGPVLSVLNVIQTIPSMALFALLIAPLAWLGARLPESLGIAGIGYAPAFIALLAYALLPIVSSMLTGLLSVPADAIDAADGMGMTARQKLWQVEMPLAVPALLTGIRIVLVQNIGLTVIAGLVGGGGLGVFVFQGISQTATDLVLLGAIPTVVMAFAAAVLLDAAVELSRRGGKGTPA